MVTLVITNKEIKFETVIIFLKFVKFEINLITIHLPCFNSKRNYEEKVKNTNIMDRNFR